MRPATTAPRVNRRSPAGGRAARGPGPGGPRPPAPARPPRRVPRARGEGRDEEAATATVEEDEGPSSSSSSTSPSTSPSASSSSLAANVASGLAKVVANPAFYLVGGLAVVKGVTGSGNDTVAAVVALSALPVVGLTLISKSDAGQRVAEDLAARKPALAAEAAAVRAAQEAARGRSAWFGPARPRLPFPAAHLEGRVAGDYGFDPLGLARDPAAFARYWDVELLHARWAMLAAVGCLVPEALTAFGGVDLGEAVWWKVGAAKLSGDLVLNYGGIEGFRIAGRLGIWPIAACQLVLMGGPEYARRVGIESLEPVGVFLPGDAQYPGGPLFDPLGLAADGPGFVDQSVKEIKNGRLAMVAMLGYAAQAAATGKGPVQNLLDFAADPARNNAVANLLLQ